MKRRINDDSDPLPYTQVDRAVKPKAALLAGRLGVSVQHALGSLVEFWELNGEPRQLERLLADGKKEVVLPADDVRRRFRMASGHELPTEDLVDLGLLEDRGGGLFRVRGMSRYFEPLLGRAEAREKGRLGGLASAAARREKHGTAQPSRSAPASTPAQAPAQADSEADSEAAPKQVVDQLLKQPPNPPEPADSGQRSLLEAAAAPEKPVRPPRRLSAAEELLVGINAQRAERHLEPLSMGVAKINALLAPLVVQFGLPGTLDRHRAYLAIEHWGGPGKVPPWPLEGFLSQARHLTPVSQSKSKPPPLEAPCVNLSA